MVSVDGDVGIKLKDFITIWQKDGTKLVEQQRREIDGFVWILFAVYYPDSTIEYGRHEAILMKVDLATQEILLHDCRNITGEVGINVRQEIDAWFEEHVGKY